MPRKYKVTGPDGHMYQFDWNADADPTPEDLDQLFSSPTTEPVTMPDPPKNAPDGFFGRSMDVMGRVGNTLSRLTGGSAVEAGIDAYQTGKPILGSIVDAYTPTGLGTFKTNPSGDQILENAGMQQGLGRAVAGFGVDLITDPGNMLGGSVLKAGKLVGLGEDVAKGVGKVADAIPGINKLKAIGEEAMTLRPKTKGIQSALGDVEYNDLARLYDSGNRAAGEGAEKLAEDMFKIKGKLIDESERKAIAHAIDTGNVASLTPEQQTLAQKFTQQMDYLHNEQVQKLGTLTPQQKIQNYVQYLTKDGRDVEAIVAPNVGAIPQSARTRQKFTTLADAVTHGGATDDVLEIAAKSTAQVERAKNKVEFLDEVMKRYQTPQGRELNFNHLNVSDTVKQKFAGLKVDPKIADDIERAVKVWEAPTEMDNIVKTANKLFKGATTALIPSHHFNNFLGNIHNLFVSGMSIKDIPTNMVHAYKAISYTDPVARAQVIGTIGRYSGKEILDAAKKFEVLGTSTHLGDLTTAGSAKIVNNKAFRAGRKFGTILVEEPARLTLFMDQLKKGKTLEQAAIKVKNVLFDYAELTNAEKGIRDYGFVPFYTWMRKNIPLQIESTLNHPEKMEAVTNLMNVPWNATDMSGVVIPEERQDAGYVPFKAQTEGNLPAMVRWALPSYDLNKMGSPGTFLADALGPLPKLAYEAASGTKMNHAPIRTSTGFSRPSGLANTLGGLDLNNLLPESLQGYVTPVNVAGRPMQADTWSWLTGAIPTGPLGSTLQGDDPLNPRFANQHAETALRVLGLTPDVLSPNDQKYEALARKTGMRRDAIRRVVLEH